MIKNNNAFFGFGFLFILFLIFSCESNDSSEKINQIAMNKSEKKILRIAYNREIDVLNALTSQNLVDIQFSMIEGLNFNDKQYNTIADKASGDMRKAIGILQNMKANQDDLSAVFRN